MRQNRELRFIMSLRNNSFLYYRTIGSGLNTDEEYRKKWQPPDQGWVKVNCDGSFDAKTGKAATGIMIRGHHGKLLNGTGRRVLTDEALTIEALAIKDRCKLAKENGFEKVVVESDSAAIIGDINRKDGRSAWKTSTVV
ncbi:hypothetical protein COLO4_28425 [Corchorus olitorius]|uniref:RNase H type-1 domain-containing protein n=1 Tax=Corchorus olitorius TaxID=93759 RepID=A0A1R3HKS7_9ROSI|nr:hypothetical protein COLO4_28425 [Corchorus olitorius]